MGARMLTDASFAKFVAPPTALARGRRKQARRLQAAPIIDRRDWHYSPETIRRVADYVVQQRDVQEGGPVGFALVLEIHAAPHLYNDDHESMVRADAIARGIDMSGRDDRAEDAAAMRGGW